MASQCHVTHRIRIFDKISEHVKVAKLVDIAVTELAVTVLLLFLSLGHGADLGRSRLVFVLLHTSGVKRRIC